MKGGSKTGKLRSKTGKDVLKQEKIPCPVPDIDRMSRPFPSNGKILSLSRCPFVL